MARSTVDYLHLDDPVRGRLNTATLGPVDGVWVDISAYVRSAHIRRGANRVSNPLPRYEAGTASVSLNDPDRRFDPTNLAGPYVASGVTQVTPMRAIRIQAVWDGVTYEVFRGFADAWVTEYADAHPYLARCELTATDATRVLSNYDRIAVGAVGAGEDSGARVNRILDSVEWSDIDRLVSTGDTTHQNTTLAGDAWNELVLTQDTEFGEVYVDSGGRVVFRNRQAAMEDLRSTSATALFGDHPTTTGVESTINIARNPSVETDTTGWNAFGGSGPASTRVRDSTRAIAGTWSLLVTWGNGADPGQLTYNLTDMVVGKTYTASVYVWVPTGSVGVTWLKAGSGFGTNTAGLRDQWVRLQVSWVALTASETFGLQLWPSGVITTGTETVWVDGLLIEEGGSVSTYVDGDEVDSEWDGTAHASTSRRLPELPYADVELAYDAETLANLVRITRVGGAEQVAEDTESRQLYLTHTYNRSDLTMQDDSTALNHAGFILHTSKDPELRFTSLVVNPRTDEDGLYPQMLGRQIGDRIRILRDPPGGGTIEREVFIRGIELDVRAGNWLTTWTLQSATKWSFFILNHGALGQLDENALSY